MRHHRSGVTWRERCALKRFRSVRRVSSSRCETSGKDAAHHKLRTDRRLRADDQLKLDRPPNGDERLKTDHRQSAGVQRSADALLKPVNLRRLDHPQSADVPRSADALLNVGAPRPHDLSRVDHQLRHNNLSADADGQQNDRNPLDRPRRNVSRQSSVRELNSVVVHRLNAAVHLHVRRNRHRKRNA